MSLTFHGVSAGYRRGLRRRSVLHEIDLELRPGQVTAVVGPGGAGKTTLLRLASGQLRPWRGRVRWEGNGGDVQRGRAARVALLPEAVTLPEGQTLARFLRYGAFLAGFHRARAESAVAAAARDARLHDALGTPLATFSRGMARRAALAFVLLRRPPVLLLDEPWGGLDPVSGGHLREVVAAEARRGTLVVVSSQAPGQVGGAADRIVILRAGRVEADLRERCGNRPSGI